MASSSSSSNPTAGCVNGLSNLWQGLQDAAKEATSTISRSADAFMEALDPGPYPGRPDGRPAYYPGGPVAHGVPVSGGAPGVPLASGVPVGSSSSSRLPTAQGVPTARGDGVASGQAFAPFLLVNGTAVTVRGLVGTPQHNGKEAQVVGYDLPTARYTVQLVEDASLLRIKHNNLLQRLSVRVVDLQERDSLNGRSGLIVGCDERGRCHVRLGQQETVALQVHNLLLPEGARVTIAGLTGNPQFNGRIGKVGGYDAASTRYTVQLSEGHELRVKRENVQL